MTVIRSVLILLSLLLTWERATAGEYISPSGKTVLSEATNGHNLSAVFVTHQVAISRTRPPKNSGISVGCTYSRYPCVVLDDMLIAFDGSPLFVPRSVSATLPDLVSAEFVAHGQAYFLVLKGGDASEGYRVVVEIDKSGVKSRRLYGAFDPDFVREETVYHQPPSAEN